MTLQPSLFVSHGAPTLAISDTPARRFLADYGASLPQPAAIAVVTAHWETDRPAVGGAAAPRTIHDFGGFPEALYRIRYAAPGAPELAQRIAQNLHDAGLDAAVDPARGLDHGVWVPLSLLFPAAEIPVVPISVQPHLGPDHAVRIGQALAALRNQGVLIVASGSLTHNLRALDWTAGDDADPRAAAFADWIDAAIGRDDRDALRDYRARAPFARFHHPTEEHLLPLFAALGAGGPGRRIHTSASFGSLMMDAYEFS
ncbi:4,5-DOPA dioxygenase extradiol-like protein [uncultured Alphaproteobacteria bacterium]|uniref:4,5-DOPA dioxygenase extradiol-like protein n=1 Tax=uncultured Alphaproteobacteria bacterium TaxID=91750 RepID=A0A212JB68_9PROT|nr:4,5-DOPA dioxygenase extradiol-like protein [uncultured Alphaproteobacteria bacterium]